MYFSHGIVPVTVYACT